MIQDNIKKNASYKYFRCLEKTKAKLCNTHHFIQEIDEIDKLNREIPAEIQGDTIIALSKYEDTWCLPFKNCTLYNPGEVAISITDENSGKLQDTNRSFIYSNGTSSAFKGFFKIRPKEEYSLDNTENGGLVLVFGKKEEIITEAIITEFYNFDKNTVIRGEQLIKSVKAFKTYDEIRKDILAGLWMAITYFHQFMLNNRYFLLETISARKKKSKIVTKGKPFFRFLHISNIRKNYIPKIDSGNKLNVGYERRRHLRTYKADRYINMKGQTVIIESTWIGPTEVFDNDVLYKIRNDVGFIPSETH